MAKTRANAQSSKPSAKFDANLKANKVKNLFSAAKLHTKKEKDKNADLKATEELLKLCRPILINLTRISPDVDRKFSFYALYAHFFIRESKNI